MWYIKISIVNFLFFFLELNKGRNLDGDTRQFVLKYKL